jgi:hypothetical protein
MTGQYFFVTSLGIGQSENGKGGSKEQILSYVNSILEEF